MRRRASSASYWTTGRDHNFIWTDCECSRIKPNWIAFALASRRLPIVLALEVEVSTRPSRGVG